MRKLTLIAGSGSLANRVAEAVQRRGDQLQIVDVVGRDDLRGDVVIRIPLSQAAAIERAVGAFGTTDLVLAGGVPLTDQDRIAIAGALGLAGKLARSMGDRALAIALLAHFALKRVRVVGADRIVADLLAPEGHIAGPAVTDAVLRDARKAIDAAREIGRLDLGQAIVMSGGRPVAAEDAGGTDELLSRVVALRQRGIVGTGFPLILAKARKPGQPRFADLPTIGPQTIERAAAAQISTVVVEAGESLLLEREALRRVADQHAVSVVGVRRARG
jgi:UDP-2,3-diacylglucosamine hydrolase